MISSGLPLLRDHDVTRTLTFGGGGRASKPRRGVGSIAAGPASPPREETLWRVPLQLRPYRSGQQVPRVPSDRLSTVVRDLPSRENPSSATILGSLARV